MAFLLHVPFLLIRFGLLALCGGRDALLRAAHFPPFEGGERVAYWFYQSATAFILLYLFFLQISFTPRWLFYGGLAVCLTGMVLLIFSVVSFASPQSGGMNQRGVYRLSRHPMYLAYFLVFLGDALLTRSWLLLCFVVIFQVSADRLVRREERWCLRHFGEEYARYMAQVRRWI